MAKEDSRPDVQTFHRSTQSILQFYSRDATDEEKQHLARTIKKAAKLMRSNAAGGQAKRIRKRPSEARAATAIGASGGIVLPPGSGAPEALAAALYSVLSHLHEVKVSGHPTAHGYIQTVVDGRFDLNEVSRKVLALLK